MARTSSTTKDETAANTVSIFERRFQNSPSLYRAPGRVNLIGEHTDYNDGFVMPAAIDFYAYVAIAQRHDRELRIYSENMQEERVLALDSLAGPPTHHWSDYIRGVAAVLQSARVNLRGADLVVNSEVPIGSGLSSSASLEVATATALLAIAGHEIPRPELAKLCQRAENEYTGARCGIMDQFIACSGKSGHALLIDCRSLDSQLLPLSEEVKIVVCNTKVKHNLAAGEYNQRRAGCEAAVRSLKKWLPQIRALRDVSLEQLEKHKAELAPETYRLAHHVVSENARVEQAAGALQRGELPDFGRLMYESHGSLRDDYQVSCKELDVMVDFASQQPGVIGARMTGGGFGGCTVNLVEKDHVAQFVKNVAEGYLAATGITPEIYVCEAADGAYKILSC